MGVEPQNNITPQSVLLVNSQRIIATIDCGKIAAGVQYAVSVVGLENVAMSDEVVGVAKVEGKGKFWLKLDAPDSVREGRTFKAVISYGNSGNANIGAELIRVVAKSGSAVRSLGSGKWVSELIIPAIGDLNHQDVILPGETRSISIECKAGSANEIRIYSSSGAVFDASPWASEAAFMLAIRETLACLSRLQVEGSCYERVYEVAVGMRDGARNHLGGGVVNSHGEAVSGVSVQLHRASDVGEELFGVVDSGKDGSFSFLNIPDGEYRISCNRALLQLVQGELVSSEGLVSVADGRVDGNLKVVVSDFHNLELLVESAGIGDLAVSVYRLNDGGMTQMSVGYDSVSGRYVVTGVDKPGLYVARANGLDKLGEVVVSLDPALTSVSHLTLRSPVTVKGVVSQLSDSVPPDGEKPYVVIRSLSTMRASVCDLGEDGAYAFEGLPAAEYTLAVGGVTRSYAFDDVYDFTAGGEFVVDANPMSAENGVTVRFPVDWGEGYAVVLANSDGVVNCMPTSGNGEVTFPSVADGCWMCRVIKIADGCVVRSFVLDTAEGRLVDFATQVSTLNVSSVQRFALKGVWSDITDAVYSAWRAFRDWSAECIAGWDWANRVIGWFQSGSYVKGQEALGQASALLSRRVDTPVDCDCGYNREKHSRDVQSVQNFAKVVVEFSQYVSTLDNMKALAMSFKSVGDSAEMLMQSKIKNGGAGFLDKLSKIRDLSKTIKSIKKSIELPASH